MLSFLFVKGMVVDHDHFVLFCGGDGKSLTVLIDVVRLEFPKIAMKIGVGYGSQEGLFPGRVFQGN